MSLLKFTSLILFIGLLSGCVSNTVKTSVSANVESEEIDIPSQAATDFKAAIELMNQGKKTWPKQRLKK